MKNPESDRKAILAFLKRHGKPTTMTHIQTAAGSHTNVGVMHAFLLEQEKVGLVTIEQLPHRSHHGKTMIHYGPTANLLALPDAELAPRRKPPIVPLTRIYAGKIRDVLAKNHGGMTRAGLLRNIAVSEVWLVEQVLDRLIAASVVLAVAPWDAGETAPGPSRLVLAKDVRWAS
jgi:hypothetical protein